MTLISIPNRLEQLKPYVPGKPITEVAREHGLTNIIKLASNENPIGPSPHALSAISKVLSDVAIYPEGSAPSLREAVARFENMSQDNIVFGAGSDEVLQLLSLAFLEPGDETVQGDPSFAMYEFYANLAGARPIKVPLLDFKHDLNAMAKAITAKTRLVFIANPNNPTGTSVSQSSVMQFLDRIPANTIVVFDQAYDEYMNEDDRTDLRPLIRAGRPVVVLHTFSKVYGLAGLRIGYGIAAPEITNVLNRVRSPFNVNSLAQSAALAALGDQDHVKRSVQLNSAGRDYFYNQLDQLNLEYVPTSANFVLIDVKRNSSDVFVRLQNRGVIIRPGASLGLPHHIRVTIGTQEQNARFIQALSGVLSELTENAIDAR